MYIVHQSLTVARGMRLYFKNIFYSITEISAGRLLPKAVTQVLLP